MHCFTAHVGGTGSSAHAAPHVTFTPEAGPSKPSTHDASSVSPYATASMRPSASPPRRATRSPAPGGTRQDTSTLQGSSPAPSHVPSGPSNAHAHARPLAS